MRTPERARVFVDDKPIFAGAIDISCRLRPQPYFALMPARQMRLEQHVSTLHNCRRCPLMQSVPVTGEPVLSQVILVGQAPGIREPALGRPFAWTGGKHLFRWFEQVAGLNESEVRSRVYFAAVCRCFPGREKQNGDRVPSATEIENCRPWMQEEFEILRPRLVIAVGRLAIAQFIEPVPRLTDLIGTMLTIHKWKRRFDLIALPHPSGASPWPMIEPGKSLTRRAVELIAAHPAWQEIIKNTRTDQPTN